MMRNNIVIIRRDKSPVVDPVETYRTYLVSVGPNNKMLAFKHPNQSSGFLLQDDGSFELRPLNSNEMVQRVRITGIEVEDYA